MHDRCSEGTRLFDAYVMALSNDKAARVAIRSGECTAREARQVQDLLISARNRYWRHVRLHECRTGRGPEMQERHTPSVKLAVIVRSMAV
jgi:hypothetical protein